MALYKAPRRYGRLLFACFISLMSLLFMRLGYWQLDRAEQSEAVAEMVRQRAEMPPVHLDGAVRSMEDLKYRRVLMDGEFEPGERIFIDGRKQDGLLGYHLIVPFRISGTDTRVMVNRGWISEMDAAAPMPSSTQVEGLVAAPRVPPLRMGGAAAKADGPWPFLDIERFARASGHPVQPFVVIADGRLAEEVLAGAAKTAEKWGMHIGYAIQWFVFALLAGILFFVVMRTKGNVEKNETE